MKVLITGATGFLGHYLARDLVHQGYEVTNFSRSNSPQLDNLGVKTVNGTILDYDQIRLACKNHDAVIHVASKVAMWGPWEEFYRTNVLGTKNVIRACQENEIPNLLYTSTPSVVYRPPGIRDGNEDLPLNKQSIGLYARSKAIAEEIVLESNSNSLKTIALRPHLIFGPGDQNLIPRLIQKANSGRLRKVGIGQNKVDVVYVENASYAHLQALEAMVSGQLKGGRPYFIGQGPVNLWDFINTILDGVGAPLVTKSISLKKAYALGALFEKSYSLFGLKNDPPMTRFVALQLGTDHFFSHAQGIQDFGFRPIYSLEQGLIKTINAFQAQHNLIG